MPSGRHIRDSITAGRNQKHEKWSWTFQEEKSRFKGCKRCLPFSELGTGYSELENGEKLSDVADGVVYGALGQQSAPSLGDMNPIMYIDG